VNRRCVFYWVIAIVIAAIAVAAAFYFDSAVRDFIDQHQDRALRRAMLAVSRFGDWPGHFILGLVLIGIAWLRGSKKWTRIFLSMLVALAMAGLIDRAIKVAFPRARPSVQSETVWGGPHFSSKYHAFPSGHVAASTAFFGVLFLARRRIALACLPIPIMIGFSRIYLRAHYLSDVVCAAVLGIFCAFFVARLLLPQINNRQSKISPPAKL
jgi:undecaprenyl-diphosphatase